VRGRGGGGGLVAGGLAVRDASTGWRRWREMRSGHGGKGPPIGTLVWEQGDVQCGDGLRNDH
jgi:hypothetical protein